MTEPARQDGLRSSQTLQTGGGQGGANLADILERVLDKGIVIAGDIQVNLLDIELLTIKLRLLVASVDKAKEMGIDWWEHDPSLSSHARRSDGDGQAAIDADSTRADELEAENEELRNRLAALEKTVHQEEISSGRSTTDEPPQRPRRPGAEKREPRERRREK